MSANSDITKAERLVDRSRVDGKVAIVTGSTQGVGQAIATLLVARGLKGLIVTGRNAARGAAMVNKARDVGCQATFVEADLANLDHVGRIGCACDEQFGRVDVLVNAAGNTDRGTILDTSPESYERSFATNVRAPFFLMQDALNIMVREHVRGSVLNIISMSAHGGQSFLSA